MFDRDADESREATEWGKRNLRLSELCESIQYDIRDASRWGGASTRYKLSDSDKQEFLQEILDWLDSLEYMVSFNDPWLNISWMSNQE